MSEVTTDELAGRLGEPELVLLDVRGADEFAGDLVSPCDPRAGRIPGARHVELKLLIEAGDPASVQALVGEPAGTEIIVYCHSGGRSGLAVQVLGAAGYEARNYTGSWHAWSRDPSLPAETGATG